MATRRERGLQRGVGRGLIASVLFVNLAAAVFVSLGVVADEALGLTPLVFVAAGIVFLLTLVGYVEAIAMMPSAGGAAGFTRRGFGELPSFLAGWALMLDYLILVVLAAYFAVHYLGSVPGLSVLLDGPVDTVTAGALILIVALMSMRGVRASARASIVVSIVALIAQLLLAAVGLLVLLEPGAISATLDIGTTPGWSGLLYALPIAMIGFTGLESVANHGEELAHPGRDVARPLIWSALVSVLTFVTLSIVALNALPVRGSGANASTQLGAPDGWVDRPVIGILDAFELAPAASNLLHTTFGLLAAGVLLLAAGSAISGVSRVAYTMARNRQAPSMLFSIDRATGVPRRAIALMTIVAIVLLVVTASLSDSAVVLAQVYAFGASFTAAIAGAAVLRMRASEPDLDRPWRAPTAMLVAGIVASTAMWCIVLATHDAARVVGLSWMIAGFVAYATYRLTHGLPLVARADERTVRAVRIDARAYHRVLVAVRPERGMLFGAGDAEVVGLADKLLERVDGTPPQVDVMLVHEVPITDALDAPRDADEARTTRRIGLLRDAAARRNLQLSSNVTRARAAGRAICQEAERLGSDAVLLATRAKRRKGDDVFGRTVTYVVRHAPCDVVVLQIPETSLQAAPAPSQVEE